MTIPGKLCKYFCRRKGERLFGGSGIAERALVEWLELLVISCEIEVFERMRFHRKCVDAEEKKRKTIIKR